VKLLSEIKVSGKKVFVRADLDVDVNNPLNSVRLKNLKGTVDYLVENGAKQVVIAGHIGRPSPRLRNGKPSLFDPELSTKNLLETLEEILGERIGFSDDLRSDLSETQGPTLNSGKIILLENLRFWNGEVKNSPEFASKLAKLADIYVNEAFGNCHRAHASMVAIAAYLPHAAGLHLQKEIEELSKLLKNPKKPFVAVVGGAKVETKIPVIQNLVKVSDKVFVGGKIALEINISDLKDEILKSPKVVLAQTIEGGKDINEDSVKKFRSLVSSAKTVVWNGPMGYFEGGFISGTIGVADAITDSNAYSVVGGGETIEFLESNNLLNKFSFVSSGGGAMLEFLSGKELPALGALH
jgi:phosphoglycerate kinase